jgi:hypothetical protein
VDFRTLRLRSHDWVRVRLVVPAPIDHDRLLDAEYDGFLPIKAVADKDGKVGDLVGTFWAGLYVMADRFKTVLEQHAIRGWHAYETVCEGLPLQTTWWVLGIAGRAGPVLTGPRAVRAGLDALGQYLDPREWDGSDMFHPANEGTVLVSSRASQAIQQARLKNVLLEPAGLAPIPGSESGNSRPP